MTDDTRYPEGPPEPQAVLGAEHVERRWPRPPFAGPGRINHKPTACTTVWPARDLPGRRDPSSCSHAARRCTGGGVQAPPGPALKNGVTIPELRALLIQCAVYAGVPTANAAFRWVREVLGDEADALAQPGDG